jgi:hypothetical protein
VLYASSYPAAREGLSAFVGDRVRYARILRPRVDSLRSVGASILGLDRAPLHGWVAARQQCH